MRIVSPYYMLEHDIAVDYIVTPSGAEPTRTRYRRPAGICWELLSEEKLAAMPLLRALQQKALGRR